ncbi:hypothetical protein ACN27F_20130 [Solwaraspora sp. WMMB335]|uniref:hypothetical protein n=1 Tax=Solwaraspora sp. WMMB335 TaxID=3404118 RepID=UPI003B954316
MQARRKADLTLLASRPAVTDRAASQLLATAVASSRDSPTPAVRPGAGMAR